MYCIRYLCNSSRLILEDPGHDLVGDTGRVVRHEGPRQRVLCDDRESFLLGDDARKRLGGAEALSFV